MNGVVSDWRFAFAQAGFALVSVVLVALGVVALDIGFLVWFAGFLVIAEVTPPSRLQAQTRRALRPVVFAGYLGVAVVVYLLFF